MIPRSERWTDAALERLEQYETDAVVATEKIRHREWRERPTLADLIPEGLTRKERMQYRLRTESGRGEYRSS